MSLPSLENLTPVKPVPWPKSGVNVKKGPFVVCSHVEELDKRTSNRRHEHQAM